MNEAVRMPEKLILIGGGGHCLSCIATIESSQSPFQIEGIVDNEANPGADLLGYPVVGGDAYIPDLLKSISNFLICVGQIRNASARRLIAANVQHHAAEAGVSVNFPVIVAGNAAVSHATLGPGTIVMQMAMVNAGARTGSHCIVNNRALIEHGVSVGDFCHVATGAIVNGDCRIGNGVFVGSGAVLKQGVSVSDNVSVAAGAVVVKDLKTPGWYAGNPARPLEQAES